MRLLLLIAITFTTFNLAAQTGYTISGKISFPNKEDEYDLRPTLISVKDATGVLVGLTSDSSLYFKVCCLTNGNYQLTVDTGDVFYILKAYDTALVVNNRDIEDLQINVRTICSGFTEYIARKDLADNKIQLIMEPGYVHFKYSFKERRIMKRYHLQYYWSGCLRYTYHSCLRAYNKVVFDFLDKKYGTKWRDKVMDKVVGLR